MPIVQTLRVLNLDAPRLYVLGHHGDYCNERKQKSFITLPKRYNTDVDMAPLNSRAWVLQERLSAPNTIHFCEDHIYLENSRGVVGEDGIAQWAGWLSCIEKSGVGRANLMQHNDGHGKYYDGNDTSDSWLRIAEIYSRCTLTYPTDKLIAIHGLVKDRQINGKYPYRDTKAFLCMWESTVHEDLLWIAKSPQTHRVTQDLQLPSWAWVGYAGPIVFLKDSRSLRERSTVQTAPVPEFELLRLTGSYDSTSLPLPEPVSMIASMRLVQLPRLGSKIPKRDEHHNEHLDNNQTENLPFRFDPGTKNRPILLIFRTDCFEIRDRDEQLKGFLTMDTAIEPADMELWLAHIATIHDESYSGPNPLSRYRYAFMVDQISCISGVGLGPEYKDSPESHILAYCMVLTRRLDEEEAGREFRRVGLAEVKYEWICRAEKREVEIF